MNDKQSMITVNEACNIRRQQLGGPSWQTWQWIVSPSLWHDSRPIVPQSDKRRHLFCTLVTVPRTSRISSVAHMSYNVHLHPSIMCSIWNGYGVCCFFLSLFIWLRYSCQRSNWSAYNVHSGQTYTPIRQTGAYRVDSSTLVLQKYVIKWLSKG